MTRPLTGRVSKVDAAMIATRVRCAGLTGEPVRAIIAMTMGSASIRAAGGELVRPTTTQTTIKVSQIGSIEAHAEMDGFLRLQREAERRCAGLSEGLSHWLLNSPAFDTTVTCVWKKPNA